MKNSLNLRISTIGAAMALTASISPQAAAIDQESPRMNLSNSRRQLSDDAITPTADEGCGEGEMSFEFDMKSDDYSMNDNSWSIINKHTDDLVAVGGAIKNDSGYHYQKCLPACGSYEFTMFDEFGDGLKNSKDESSFLKTSIDGQEVMSLNSTEAQVQKFEKKSVAFDGGDKCTKLEVHRIVLSEDPYDSEYCIQPRNLWKGDTRIVAKTCKESKPAQFWTVDYMGQWHLAMNETLCLTKQKNKLFLKDSCKKKFSESKSTNFIYNELQGTMHWFKDNMKVFRINNRDMSLWLRKYVDNDDLATLRQRFSIKKDFMNIVQPTALSPEPELDPETETGIETDLN